MKKIFVIPVLLSVIWAAISFYQIKTSHAACYEMGYLRGHPGSIACFEKELQMKKENFQGNIMWGVENHNAILIYIWNLGT